MNKNLRYCKSIASIYCIVFCILVLPYSGAAQLCLNLGGSSNPSTITENFNGLGNSPAPKNTETSKLISLSALLPNNPPATRFLGRFDNTINDLSQTVNVPWAEVEEGPSSTTVSGRYNFGVGDVPDGNTYSFGSNASADRALGSMTNGNAVRNLLGACFTNTTGSSIAAVYINYTGEQWRDGGGSIADRFDFQYAVDDTPAASDNIFTANDGAFTDFNGLDFASSVNGATAAALDGNAAPNRYVFPVTTVTVTIPAGSVLYLRWVDNRAGGSTNDDGLAIDDFRISLFAPTAANVNIGGRILSSTQSGIANARVNLTATNGTTQTATTNPFGYYRFVDISIGDYLINVHSKRFSFADSTNFISVMEDLPEINFTAVPRKQ